MSKPWLAVGKFDGKMRQKHFDDPEAALRWAIEQQVAHPVNDHFTAIVNVNSARGDMVLEEWQVAWIGNTLCMKHLPARSKRTAEAQTIAAVTGKPNPVPTPQWVPVPGPTVQELVDDARQQGIEPEDPDRLR